MKTRRRRLLQSVALSLVLLACVATVRAGAEVQLSGTQDKVVLRAKNATLDEILSGIQSTFNVRVQLTGSTARQFTGAYAGAVRRVLSRLLDGEDYVISSAADGVTIVLVDRKGGAPTAAKVASRVAAGGQEETNPVQGWVPDRNIVTKPRSAATPPAPAQRAGAEQPVRLAALGDEDNNPVQGWTGSGIMVAQLASAAAPAQANAADAAKPQPADTAQPVKLAAGGDDENNSVQGWTGSGVLFATPAAATAPAQQNAVDAAKPQTTDAAKPQAGDTDGNPNVQGWEPTGNPFKDLSAKAAPVVDNSAAPSVPDKDEGNPNFQGYVPDWTPPGPGKSALDSMPMLPRAAIGMHRQ